MNDQFSRAGWAMAVVAGVLASGCALLRTTTPYQEGIHALALKQYEQGDDLLARVTPDDPDYARAQEARGTVAHRQERHEEAVRFFQTAMQSAPGTFDRARHTDYNESYARIMTRGVLDLPGAANDILGRGERVVVRAYDTLVAHDLTTSRALWSVALGRPRDTRDIPVLAGDTVIAADHRKGVGKLELTSFDLATGSPRWVHPVGRSTLGIAPAVGGAHVYFAAGSGNDKDPYQLRALDAGSGAVLWSYPLDGAASRVSTAGGRVFVRTQRGTVHAAASADGHALWSVTLPVPYANEQLVASDTFVYLAAKDGKVYALDASEKQYERPLERVRWEAPNSNQNQAEAVVPTLIGGVLVVPRDRAVEGLDAATGKVRFRTEHNLITNSSRYSPTTSGGEGDVIWAKYASCLVLLDAAGHLRWVYSNHVNNDRKLMEATPLLLGGRLFVGARDTDGKHAALALEPRPALPY